MIYDWMLLIGLVVAFAYLIIIDMTWGKKLDEKQRQIDSLFVQLGDVQIDRRKRAMIRGRSSRNPSRNPKSPPLGSEFDQAWAKENGIKLDD